MADGKTIHSSGQMEHHKIIVKAPVFAVTDGLHYVELLEGYRTPLCFINGLPCMRCILTMTRNGTAFCTCPSRLMHHGTQGSWITSHRMSGSRTNPNVWNSQRNSHMMSTAHTRNHCHHPRRTTLSKFQMLRRPMMIQTLTRMESSWLSHQSRCPEPT
jgi:hypothetical protein